MACFSLILITLILFFKINLSYPTTLFFKLLQKIKPIFQSRKSKERILLDKYKSIYSTLAQKL